MTPGRPNFLEKERLTSLAITHKDFLGQNAEGTLEVLDILVPHVIEIFDQLYKANFPIEKMVPMEAFSFDDIASMTENNTSCYNPRYIAGTNMLSIHAYGVAIDINPRENPCIINGTVCPEAGAGFLNRDNQVFGMLEPVVPIFKKYGFVWGGDWASPIDYHHYQLPRAFSDFLVSVSPQKGGIWLDWYVTLTEKERMCFLPLVPKLALLSSDDLQGLHMEGSPCIHKILETTG